jgi:hypothetical protein
MTTSPPNDEERKRAIFEGMSERARARILKTGYDKWDPFVQPRDPIDLRVDRSKHTVAMLVRAFLSSGSGGQYDKAYTQGVWEICVGLINESERYRGMYEFSNWYRDFLARVGPEDSEGAG